MLILDKLNSPSLSQEPTWQGLPLAKRDDGSLIGLTSDAIDGHTLVIGPGKERRDLQITAAIAVYDKALIVIDPSQEQYERTVEVRREIGPVFRWPPSDYDEADIDPTFFLSNLPSDWIAQKATIYITYKLSDLTTPLSPTRKSYVQRSINRIMAVLTQQEIESGDLVCFVDEAILVVLDQLAKLLERLTQNKIWTVLYIEWPDQLAIVYGEFAGDQILEQCSYRVWYPASYYAKPKQLPLSFIEMMMLDGERVVVELGDEVIIGQRLMGDVNG
ncbi:MAG: hypothetical protein AAGD96_34675 [Chloroflexota bacterium]